MSPNNPRTNPFAADLPFESVVLAEHPEIQYLSHLSLLGFKQTYLNQPNFIMSIKKSYLKFVHTVTQHAILATFVMLLALTTVSASAAELFAPEEYKPSTLLGLNSNNNNSDKEKELYQTNLKSENEYDLTIEYTTTNKELNITGKVYGINGCSTLTNQNLETEINRINLEITTQESKDLNCTQEIPELEVNIKVEDLGMNTEELNTNFDNIFNVNLTKQTQNLEPTSTAKPLVADADHDVVVIPECDLAVRYGKYVVQEGYVGGGFNMLAKPSPIANGVEIAPDNSGPGTGFFPATNIYCYNANTPDSEIVNLTYYKLVSESKNEFCEKFTLASSCDLIQNYQYYETESGDFGTYGSYVFTANDKKYYIPTPGGEAYFHPNLKFQFNSLAPSTPSVSLEGEKDEADQKNTPAQTKTQQSSQTDYGYSEPVREIQMFVQDGCDQNSGYFVSNSIPDNGDLAAASVDAMFADKRSFFYGFNKYLVSAEKKPTAPEVLLINLKPEVRNDPKWGILSSSCGMYYFQEVVQTATQFDDTNAAFFVINGEKELFQIGDEDSSFFWTSRG